MCPPLTHIPIKWELSLLVITASETKIKLIILRAHPIEYKTDDDNEHILYWENYSKNKMKQLLQVNGSPLFLIHLLAHWSAVFIFLFLSSVRVLFN